MTHLLFLAVRTFPFWGVPLILVLVQLFAHFMRTRSPLRFPSGAAIGILGVSVVAWAVFRGDLHADDWVRFVLGQS
jgi:MFS superfamily sulfate permease-like transporter